MWITKEQAATLIPGETFTDQSLERASARLEAVPFRDDALRHNSGAWANAHARFVDGFAPDATGKAIEDQPIPRRLGIAVAILALVYAKNPVAGDFDRITTTDFPPDQNDTMLDLPIAVRNAIWEYVPDDLKNIEATVTASEDEETERQQATPIGYV